MATVIDLPQVAVSRKQADMLVNEACLDNGAVVEINGRNLGLNTNSFAVQLVTRLAEVPGVSITARGGGSEWINELGRLAKEHQVALKSA